MHFSEETISLADIFDADLTYRITTASNIDELTHSLAVIGLIHPPILQRIPSSGYRIVAGFRRVAATRSLGLMPIRALVLPDDSDTAMCVKLAIGDNSLQRPLNLIESSRALNLLHRIAVDEQHLIEMAAGLSLPDNPAKIAKLITLSSLPETIQNGVQEGHLTLSMALELNAHDIDTAEALARIFTDLRLGLNRQRELLTHLFEIAKRKDRSISDVLAADEIRQIIDNDEYDRGQKSLHLKEILNRWRFPAISEKISRFQELVKKLRLGRGVGLLPPKNFEGTAYTLSITFDRFEQLGERGQCLNVLMQSAALKKFLEE